MTPGKSPKCLPEPNSVTLDFYYGEVAETPGMADGRSLDSGAFGQHFLVESICVFDICVEGPDALALFRTGDQQDGIRLPHNSRERRSKISLSEGMRYQKAV